MVFPYTCEATVILKRISIINDANKVCRQQKINLLKKKFNLDLLFNYIFESADMGIAI